MDQVSLFLLTVAGLFLVGVVGEMVFRRTQVPDAAWLVAIGIVLGPVTGLLDHALLGAIAPFFAALTLIVILFEGGRRLSLDGLARRAPHALLMTVLTFAGSCAVVALAAEGVRAAGWMPPAWTFLHSLLLGAILGGPSSVIVMPAMNLARVPPRVGDVASLEAALTDILCVVGAGTIVQLLNGGAGTEDPLGVLGRTFGVGLGIGAAAGAVWILLLGLLRQAEHAFALTLSALLILYVAVDRTGGSAPLAVLVFAVLVGNAAWIAGKAGLVLPREAVGDGRDVHTQLVFVVKTFFFTFIGAMLGPPWGFAAFGVLLGLLLLPARLPGAWAAARMMRLAPVERGVLAVALPRGLAAGVLATLPVAAGVPGTEILPGIVFPAVITTIVLFTVGFARVRRGGRGQREEGGAPPPAPPRMPDAAAP